MVNFGQRLIDSKHEPWTQYYINYEHLKRLIEDEYPHPMVQTTTDGAIMVKRTLSDQSLLTLRSFSGVSLALLKSLHTEAERVSLFVITEQGRIATQLAECRRKLPELNEMEDENIFFQLEDLYTEVGIALLNLIRFVHLNVTGFRKILKKHDKLSKKKLSPSYLAPSGTPYSSLGLWTKQLQPGNNNDQSKLISLGNQQLQPLLKPDTIHTLTCAYEAGTEELQHLRTYCQGENDENIKLLDHTSRSMTSPNLFLASTDFAPTTAPKKSFVAHLTASNRSHGDIRNIFGSTESDRPSPSSKVMRPSPGQVLIQIYAARGRLYQTNEFTRLLAAPMMYEGIIEQDETSLRDEVTIHQRPTKFSNYLNLLSTFFYMTNYYIVAPTSATYADKIGSDSSIASIIIGMTAVAALVSTLLYSWWTSYSYKHALLFASSCSVIGNLLYAAGLPCQSLTLVMTGRLLTGFGSARSINRRYIADSYAPADRTAASAAFVTASALGMAMGPALASILHLATEESESVYWQPENAPGWCMLCVWLIFLVCLVWKFEDPPRLKERKIQQGSDDKFGTKDEKTPLIHTSDTVTSTRNGPSVPLCCNIPVMVTLVVYMVLKMVLEAVLSSEANLTAFYFGWEGNIMGVHLTILALLILPVNFSIAYLAKWYFDRELIIGLLVAMLGGCIVIYQYQDEDYALWQYLIGSAILFVCASALEAPNMALLSKVIPLSWRKGIVNVGLLATESGTLGRVIGDFLLAGMATNGLENMLNEAFGAFGGIILATLAVCVIFYRRLQPVVEKDEQ